MKRLADYIGFLFLFVRFALKTGFGGRVTGRRRASSPTIRFVNVGYAAAGMHFAVGFAPGV